MSVINTNITSMIAQQNLNDSKGALETNMERLSSGLRINSAKDDAAGQAIANRFDAQTTGLGQAQRNANDGISVAQTAEGALDQINDNVQRVRELTVQAANGTNSDKDLNSIQDEIDQRMDEVDRISQETDFNGVKVLKEDSNLQIQVGANDNETISVNLNETNSEALELDKLDVTKAFTSDISEVTKVDETTSQAVDDSGIDISSLDSNATIDDIGQDEDGNWFANVSDTTSTDDGYYAISVDDQGVATANLSSGDVEGSDPATYDAVSSVDAPTGNSNAIDTSGLTAPGDGEIARVVEDNDGDAYVQVSGADDKADNGFYAAKIDSADGTVTVGGGTDFSGGTTDIPDGPQDSSNIAPLNALDDALNKIDSQRSELGAVQNRFESAINNLSTNETNLSDAQSRIEDADYASEVADMTKNQILQQAGTSVLAQANQLPQNALSLLG